MDLKKALDKTVRNMKREVNKKVLKVPEIERKVLEATCNEPWGPHGTLMADIAQATRNFNEYQMIMSILWKRLNDRGKNWRHVLKSLTVMEFLVGHGTERFIDDLREHTYQIQTLVDFQYVDSSGRDQGITVRRKAQSLVSLINDKEKIREYRQKAAANRDKYRGVSSVGGIYRSSSYSSTGGSYSDRDDDDRSGGGRYSGREDRYRDGERYDDRYRDGDKYRDDDRYGYGRDNDRHYNDRHYSEKYDGPDRDRGYEDARSSGSKDDDDWKSDRKQSRRSNPPSYEEVSSPTNGQDKAKGITPVESPAQKEETFAEEVKEEASPVDEFDPRGSMHGSGSHQDLRAQEPKLTSTVTAPASFMSAVEELFAETSTANNIPSTASNEFDPSNPFGTSDFHADGMANGVTNAFVQPPPQQEQDALALALVPQQQTEQEPQPQVQPQPHSENSSQLSQTQNIPPQQQQQQVPAFPPQHQPSMFNPHTVQQQSFLLQQQFPPQQQQQQQPPFFPHNQTFVPPQQPPNFLPQQQQQAHAQAFAPQQPQPNFLPQQQQQQQAQAFAPPQAQPNFLSQQQQHPPNFQPPSYPQASFPQQPQQQQQLSQTSFPQQQQQQQQAPTYSQNFAPQQQAPTYSQTFAPQQQQQQQQGHGTPETSVHAKPKQQEPFQPKSAVWADTLSTGLVNLNIGPLKSDPLAELGIQLTESKVSVARREEKKISSVPTTKGQAMGSGSGLGLAGASIMHRPPPPPPPIMGGQMGMGMGMGMGMMPPPPMGMHPGMMAPPPPMMNHPMGMGMGGMGGMGMMGSYPSQQGGFR